ncbi:MULTISPECIES: aldehyde dehydrogenase family protein [unclassified Bacillus (in: firmicutes)]|uniref:aldehyde dehydrogenase family protein n=1 Tax=unclassified Bacillus (in: firmicutes) TaxID=185979 RepID=UPI001BE9546B|nr:MULTISPECIES: aldehyde dehydrogenase family protein [unclassified Bacillus (in: firmicutes)]MBT2618890.1 aldehyde dehydrogenase family protein [Bacillus sp. ISL-78]MBT2627866.1 aldehyde dehydrogenase family protein [Bacillus sp. ISL-101]
MIDYALKLHPKTLEFLKETKKKLYINGEWEESIEGNTFKTINPATGEVLATIHEAGEKDVDAAVEAASSAFEEGIWPEMSSYDRSRLMHKLADLIERDIDVIAQLDTLDNGKSINELKNGDIPNAIETLRYYAGWTTKMTGQTIPISHSYLNYTEHEPVGVVGQIIPWNFPFMMALWKIAPALATGCTIILKPAEQTPLSALYLATLIEEAGFPKGVINIINGFGKTAGDALVKHPKVNKIAFTGSTPVGRVIMKEAANTMKRVTLELGGKSPNIILPDADLDKAIPGVFSGIMVNQGQVCCAGSRVFIPDHLYNEVVERLVDYAKEVKLGNGLNETTEMGPLVSERQQETVTSYIKKGIEEGATLLVGGERSEKGYFVSPAVFADVGDEMTIAKEEIFGPVVVAMPYSSIDEVVKRANSSQYGLAAGLWTENLKNAHKISRKLKAGTVWVNCYNITNSAAPFGGYKESGFGREMGSYALDNYTEVKSVWVNLD